MKGETVYFESCDIRQKLLVDKSFMLAVSSGTNIKLKIAASGGASYNTSSSASDIFDIVTYNIEDSEYTRESTDNTIGSLNTTAAQISLPAGTYCCVQRTEHEYGSTGLSYTLTSNKGSIISYKFSNYVAGSSFGHGSNNGSVVRVFRLTEDCTLTIYNSYYAEYVGTIYVYPKYSFKRI